MDTVKLFKEGKLVNGNGEPVKGGKIEKCSLCGKEVFTRYGAYGWNATKKICYDCDCSPNEELTNTYYGSDEYLEDGYEARYVEY